MKIAVPAVLVSIAVALLYAFVPGEARALVSFSGKSAALPRFSPDSILFALEKICRVRVRLNSRAGARGEILWKGHDF